MNKKMDEMNNIMIDVETLGTEYNPVILSIGAIFFNEIETGNKFYIEISLEDSLALKHNITAETLRFWMNELIKNNNHINIFMPENKTKVSDALFQFYNFCTENKPLNRQKNFKFLGLGNA